MSKKPCGTADHEFYQAQKRLNHELNEKCADVQGWPIVPTAIARQYCASNPAPIVPYRGEPFEGYEQVVWVDTEGFGHQHRYNPAESIADAMRLWKNPPEDEDGYKWFLDVRLGSPCGVYLFEPESEPDDPVHWSLPKLHIDELPRAIAEAFVAAKKMEASDGE